MSTPKKISRPQRWQDACSCASTAASDLESALSELVEIQDEYGEYESNLPEELQQSVIGVRLRNLCGISLRMARWRVADEIKEILQEAIDANRPIEVESEGESTS